MASWAAPQSAGFDSTDPVSGSAEGGNRVRKGASRGKVQEAQGLVALTSQTDRMVS